MHIIGLVVIFGAGAAGCSESEAQPREPGGAAQQDRAIAVRTIEVKRRDLRETIDYVGTIRYRREVKVGARVAGTVQEVNVAEGDVVAEGDLLAAIETPELRQKLRGMSAETRRLAAQQAQACHAAEADRRMAEQGALPGLRADASATNCEALRQAVNAARARRAEIRTSLGFADVRASAPGVILDLMIEPGEIVGPGRPLLVQGTGPKEIEVQVNDEDLLRGVRVGTKALIRAAGADSVLQANVLRVAPIATGPGRHVAVRLDLPAELAPLPPGVAVDVRFIVREERDASPVPLRAIARTESGDEMVFVVHDGRALRVPITRGLSSRGWVAVHPPLDDGTRVVTSNLGMVRDGSRLLAVPERTGEARP